MTDRRALFYGFGHRGIGDEPAPPIALADQEPSAFARQQQHQQQQYLREQAEQAAYHEALQAAQAGRRQSALAWLAVQTTADPQWRQAVASAVIAQAISACSEFYLPGYNRLAAVFERQETREDWRDEEQVIGEVVTPILEARWEADESVDSDEFDQLIETQWCRCLGLRLAEYALSAPPLAQSSTPLTLSEWEIVFSALLAAEAGPEALAQTVTQTVTQTVAQTSPTSG
jgi:hypothetical protein